MHVIQWFEDGCIYHFISQIPHHTRIPISLMNVELISWIMRHFVDSLEFSRWLCQSLIVLLFSIMGHFMVSFDFPWWLYQDLITTFLDLITNSSFNFDFGYVSYIRYKSCIGHIAQTIIWVFIIFGVVDSYIDKYMYLKIKIYLDHNLGEMSLWLESYGILAW